jgi:hypothetical protein
MENIFSLALKPVEVILRWERGKRENNGRDELNWGTLYACIELSQLEPLVQLLHTNKMLKKAK